MGGFTDGKRGSDDMVVMTQDSRQPKFFNKKKQMFEDDK